MLFKILGFLYLNTLTKPRFLATLKRADFFCTCQTSKTNSTSKNFQFSLTEFETAILKLFYKIITGKHSNFNKLRTLKIVAICS